MKKKIMLTLLCAAMLLCLSACAQSIDIAGMQGDLNEILGKIEPLPTATATPEATVKPSITPKPTAKPSPSPKATEAPEPEDSPLPSESTAASVSPPREEINAAEKEVTVDIYSFADIPAVL